MTLFRTLKIAATLSLAIALSTLTPTATASNDDQYLVLSTGAYHFKNQEDRNALTPGVGWEYSPSGKIGFHIGTLSDSFGYQARYGGINYATPRYAALGGRVRFLIGATVLHKQYHENAAPQTKVVPLPALEIAMSDNAVLNISGSPEIDYAGEHSNAVMFFQLKLNLL